MRKVVLITGGTSDIGKACINLFFENGYDISFSYFKNESEAKKISDKLRNNKCKVLSTKADFNCENDVKRLFENTIKHFGRIDCLINNAALELDNLIENKTKQDFLDILNVNLIAPFLLSRLVGDYMYKNKSGNIINISSTNGIDTYYKYSLDYDASKSALISLTHNLSENYCPYVRVNSVAPGWVNTKTSLKIDDNFKKQEEDKIYVKRFANPKEIANVIYFLASDKASYINNEVIRVDGGTRHL